MLVLTLFKVLKLKCSDPQSQVSSFCLWTWHKTVLISSTFQITAFSSFASLLSCVAQ